MSRHTRLLLYSLALLASFCRVPSASGQSISVVGSVETLEIATWNVEWFGSSTSGPGDDDLQRENVRRVVAESEIDLWALQEVSDETQFLTLMDELGPPWEGYLADFPALSGQQRIGFVLNSTTIRLRNLEHILETFSTGSLPPIGSNYFAGRAPLQLEADVILPDTTVTLTFITLHMKCCGDQLDYERRSMASLVLKNRIDFFHGVQNSPIAAVLGDFNDELGASIYQGATSPYQNFLGDSDHYRFLTEDLDAQNIPTYCRDNGCFTGSTLDHILLTDEVIANYVDGSVHRLESALDAISGYTNTTSDHLPVYAVFSFPTSTAIENPAALPGSIQITGLYPNPAGNAVNLEIESDGSRTLSLTVFDVLGRVVYRTLLDRPIAGSEQLLVPTMELATGTYLLRVESSAGSAQRTFLKAN